MKSRNPVIEFDDLQMFFGEPYTIDVESAMGSITIYQPRFGEIIKMGQIKFFSSLNIFVANTTSYRLLLWDMGIDWNELSDFNLFLLLYKQIDPDVSRLIFKDLDLQTFEIFQRNLEDKEELILYNDDLKIEINEEVYFYMSQYLRKAFSINPEEKLTSDPIMKEWFISKDRRQASIDEEKAKKNEARNNSLLPLISACVNHPGFKYKLEELKDITVCQFYDSVHRLQIYENSTALLKGMYSGFVDAKKIKPDDYNFMK